ncbi:MAG: exo-alpha-sialidase [Bacteroidota bacterium]|nr:exo-alpha-sialidase [Bacteroidota bacterium]MDP4230715.1 exo-alpha-sialidase [Bacteroidota bacterium]MDP4236493.1 exo-alpha-sialidase [Bacteroidota bacterium]
MRKLLILGLLLVFVQSVSAQKPWKWSRAKGPSTGSLAQGLYRGVNGEIIALTLSGYYVSSDQGNTWDFRQILPNSETQPISHFFISSDGTYYFYVSSRYSYSIADSASVGMYQSTDHGNSWNRILKGLSIFSMIESTDHSLYMSSRDVNGQKVIFESIDNGKSWVGIPGLSNSPAPAASIGKYVFLNSGYNVLRFDPATQISENFSDGLHDIGQSLVRIDSLLYELTDTCIYYSDGEQPWQPVCGLKGTKSLVKGEGNTILALLQRDVITNFTVALSMDKGLTWDSIASITYQASPIEYSHADELIYQTSEALVLSTDRSASWKEIGFPYASVSLVFAKDEHTSFANTLLGTTLISTDHGNTWSDVNPGHSYTSVIVRGPGETIFDVTEDGRILIFDSTLIQWKLRAVRLVDTYQGIMVSDRSKFMYLVAGQSILRSDDTGYTWLDLNVPNTGNSIYSIDANTYGAIYFGTYPEMFRSEDNGNTWTRLLPVHGPIQLTQIKCIGTAGVLLGTEGAGLLFSNDKGNSWTRIDGNRFDTVQCMTIDSKGAIAAGTNRGLWIRDPSSFVWAKAQLGRDEDLFIEAIDVAPNDDFYVGTSGAGLWIGTRNYSSTHSSGEPISSMKIFPDPAIENFNVSIGPTPNMQERLELYDLLGRRIAVLAEGEYPDGKVISFETSTLPSGIYTVIRVGPQLRQAQKLVVRH